MIKKNKKLSWTTQKRKVADLIPCSYNPRTISADQQKQLIQSLKTFGLAEIPAINTDNQIIAGHQRITALVLLGRKDEIIEVRVPNRKLTKQEADEYMVRSNKNTGDWDFSILGKEFNFDFLEDIGFNDFELDNIFERICKEDDFDAEAEYAKIETPKTKKGDIYILGNHKLMCGSSTDEKDFERLMDGKFARMVFTDPPYNVDYQSASKTIKKDNLKGKILNDKMTEEECQSFFIAALKNFYKFSSDDASIYWWYASTNQHICRDAFVGASWYLSQIIIWVKNGIVLSRSQDYHKTYEPCMFGWKKKKKHYKDKKIKNARDLIILDKDSFAEQLDVWYENRDNTAKYVHPTQKPVRLAERALKRNSKSKDIVLDGFGGSGSTLIACEQLGRHCYAMELDPKYCDVIVKRWELLTNQKARLMRG